MGRIISVIADDLSLLADVGGMAINGGWMCAASLMRQFIAQDSTAAIELFLPPSAMLRVDELRDAARDFLPPNRRGQGALRFYPLHSLPEVWADAAPRVLYCADAEWMPRQRYLRDRYARGPMPIVADTHSLSPHSFWLSIERLLAAPHVAHDSILSRSRSTHESLERGFAWLESSASARPGAVPPRIHDLPYGVDLETFRPPRAEEKIEARRALNLPERGTIAAFFGRVTAYSKADMLPLLEAFARATDRHDDYLLIAGREYPSGYAARLREAGESLGLGDRLLIRGEAAPILRPLFFRAADIFVFPGETTVETFGCTVVEAMGSALPVIVSDWDGLRGHFVDGEHGYSVPTWWMPGTERISAFSPFVRDWSPQLFLGQSVWVDTTVLEDALRRLLDDPELRARMGAAGREHAVQKYSWPSVMQRWEALWTELEDVALKEDPDAAAVRRAGAERLALPMPYQQLFGHYATGVFDTGLHGVRLTERGIQVVEGTVQPLFYDETLPLLHEVVLEALFEILAEAGEQPLSIEALTREAAVTGADEDIVRFHIGLLLKRGLVEVGGLGG